MATEVPLRARRAAPVARVDKKTVRVHKRGGSFSVTLPKAWLPGIVDGDTVVMRRRGRTIEIIPERRPRTIEDESEFALFMSHLLHDALAHPEALVPIDDLFAGSDDLLAGVEPDL